MRLLVYMRDGRTVYFIAGRANLGSLLRAHPAHEDAGVMAVRGIWNPTTGEYVWSRGITLRFLAQSSVSVIEEGQPNDVRPPAEDAA